MDLDKFLLQQRDSILKKWFHLVVDTYHPQTARMLKAESNEFANPVGHTTFHGLEGVYDEFIRGAEPDKISPFLDQIIRIRAIQDFSPSQAVAFVFALKKIVREQLAKVAPETPVSSEDLSAYDSRVDELALLAFDIYAQCRENLFEVRVNEVKSRSFRLLQMANLVAEIPEQEPELEGGKTR